MTTLDGVTPYPPEFAERYRALGYWEDRTLGQWFDETCARFETRVALVAPAEQITYQQLAERVERLALYLLKLGLRPLDRFIMQLPNIPEFVYLYFVLQKISVIPIMALAPHRYTEIEQFVRLSEAVGYAIPERLGDFSFTRLAKRVQKEIARFKLPERLEALEELPLSRFGKVMKQALVEQAKALVAKSPSSQKP